MALVRSVIVRLRWGFVEGCVVGSHWTHAKAVSCHERRRLISQQLSRFGSDGMRMTSAMTATQTAVHTQLNAQSPSFHPAAMLMLR